MNHRIVTVPASHVVVRMDQLPEQSFSFLFELAKVKLEREGADLLIKFANQGKVILRGFFPPDAETDMPLVVLASGQVVPGEFLCMTRPELNEKPDYEYAYALEGADALPGKASQPVGMRLCGRNIGRQSAF